MKVLLCVCIHVWKENNEVTLKSMTYVNCKLNIVKFAMVQGYLTHLTVILDFFSCLYFENAKLEKGCKET